MYSQIRNISIACIILVALGGIFQTAAADIEANKAIMLRAEEFWNTGNMAIADEVYGAEFVNHDPTDPDVGDLESYKGFVAAVRAGMPDFHVTAEAIVAEADKVASRWTVTGTQTGEFFGIPPTGIQARWTGITIYRYADGKVVEAWWSKDVAGMLEQLGVAPPTREIYTWGEPSDVTGDPGDPETNKAIFQGMFDEVFKGNLNLDVIDELFAADYVMHDPAWPGEVKGPEGFKQWTSVMFEPFFSDSHIAAEDIIAEGDKVAVRWTWSGTHTGEFMGIPATGRQIAITGTTIHRFADGKFVESWASYDTLGMVQQLTAPEWPLAGTWIGWIPAMEPTTEPAIIQETFTPLDPAGDRLALRQQFINADPTWFGMYPEADNQSHLIGEAVKTGLNTYEFTIIGYGFKNQPADRGQLKYIWVSSATTTLTDRNTRQDTDLYISLYGPDKDVNPADGLPDEGAEPDLCLGPLGGEWYKRVPLMPPCVPPPPPPEPEGE